MPSYRQRVQQYVLKNVLSILTRVKQNVMTKLEPKKECQPEIKNETIPTMISSLSPIRRVKQEVEHKGTFITKPRLATWSAWDRVDHDLRIEVTRLSTLSASRWVYYTVLFINNELIQSVENHTCAINTVGASCDDRLSNRVEYFSILTYNQSQHQKRVRLNVRRRLD